MKITKENLEKIIKEELENVLLENELVNKLRYHTPKIAKNPVAKKTFKIAKTALKQKKISVRDFLSLSSGLYHAIKDGQDEASFAIKNPGGLAGLMKKANLDVEIGDITKNVSDPSIAGKSGTSYDDRVTGGKVDFGNVYGVNFKISL